MTGRRFLVAVVGVAVVGALGAGWIVSRSMDSSPASSRPATRLVAVVRTDLILHQAVSGTVGVATTWTVRAVGGPGPNDVATATDAWAGARDQLDSARASLSAAAAASRSAIAADRAQLSAAHAAGSAGATSAARLRLASDQAEASATWIQGRGAVASAQRALAASKRQLDQQVAHETFGGATMTEVPAVGTTIERGAPLFWVDGRAVFLFLGSRPVVRSLREGDAGDDVRQLQENLIAFGDAATTRLASDGLFGPSTTSALRHWQQHSGLPQTGTVLLGEVVFLPGAVRVMADAVSAGAAYVSNAPIIDVAPSGSIVNIALDPSLQANVAVNDPVELTLPTGAITRGRITSVASVAAPAGQAGAGGSSGAQLAIRVTVAPDDSAALAHLDQALVSVSITTGHADGILAVPIDALVAVSGGGSAVEVDRAGARSYVSVTPGFFTDALVQVTGAGLDAGMQVVVPGE